VEWNGAWGRGEAGLLERESGLALNRPRSTTEASNAQKSLCIWSVCIHAGMHTRGEKTVVSA
jgi:hypothetical protein